MRKINISKSFRIWLGISIFGCLWLTCAKKLEVFENLDNGVWREVLTNDKSIPVKRHEAAFVKLKDKFYLLGGRGMKPTSIYHPKSNSWSQGSLVPIELHHFQPVVFQEEIYIIGAMTGPYPGETPVPQAYIYNPKTDVWRKGFELPKDRLRGGAGAAIHDDKIYLACGIQDGHRSGHVNWLDVYDIKTKQWTKLADAPRPRDHFQIVIDGGKLFNLGGRTTVSADNPFKNTIQEIDVYDIENQSWSTLENKLPTPRAGNFTLKVGNEILVLGGESFYQQAAHPEVEALNLNTLTWRRLPEIPRGRHGTGAILYNNGIYTASGCGNRGGEPELEDLWVYEF